jgi:hypothetical protein
MYHPHWGLISDDAPLAELCSPLARAWFCDPPYGRVGMINPFPARFMLGIYRVAAAVDSCEESVCNAFASCRTDRDLLIADLDGFAALAVANEYGLGS